jgi:hypothetical protein
MGGAKKGAPMGRHQRGALSVQNVFGALVQHLFGEIGEIRCVKVLFRWEIEPEESRVTVYCAECGWRSDPIPIRRGR